MISSFHCSAQVEVVVTTGAISRAKLQSNHHCQQTNMLSFNKHRLTQVHLENGR